MGGHERQTDKQNGEGVEGGRPERTGARTAQTGLVRVFWVLRPRSPALEAKRKGNFYKCQELVTWGRGRKRSSPHSPPEPPWYCSAVPLQLGAESERAPCPAPVPPSCHCSIPNICLFFPSPMQAPPPPPRSTFADPVWTVRAPVLSGLPPSTPIPFCSSVCLACPPTLSDAV